MAKKPFCFFSLLSVFSLLIGGRLCDRTGLNEFERHFGTFDQMMREQIVALEQPLSAAALIQRIGILRGNAGELAKSIELNARRKMGDHLIYEHAVKIRRFCDNVLIGEEGVSEEVIGQRWHMLISGGDGIGQIKARVGQVQRLTATNLIGWEDLGILYEFNLSESPPEGWVVNDLGRKLGMKIGQMMNQVARGKSYYGQMPFRTAMGQLAKWTTDQNEDGAAKLGKLFQIVPQLMVEATGEMLKNFAVDTLGANGAFYGTKFLLEFSKIANLAETQCEALVLRTSTVPNAQQMVSNLFNGLKNEANAKFEMGKVAIGEHFQNIGTRLKNEMAKLRIALGKALEKHPPKRHKIFDGTSKQHSALEIMKDAQNVLVVVHNLLDMVDLQYPAEMVSKKLAKLVELMKRDNVAKMDVDDYELHDEILDCLSTEEIEKRIQIEIQSVGYQMLF